MKKSLVTTLAILGLAFAAPAVAGNNNGPDFGGTNTATATGGSGGDAFAGAAAGAGVFDSGNSESEAGVFGSGNSHNDNTAITGPSTAISGPSFSASDQEQGQEQAQHQGQGQGQSVTIEDNSSFVRRDADTAASSAATLVLGSCQTGVSAQTHMGGGALGSPDTVCLLFTASQVAQSQGNQKLAAELLDRAVQILYVRDNPVRHWIQALPLVGKLF